LTEVKKTLGSKGKSEGKDNHMHAYTGPYCSRRLRLPEFLHNRRHLGVACAH